MREHGGRIGKRHKERAGCQNSRAGIIHAVNSGHRLTRLLRDDPRVCENRTNIPAHLIVFHTLNPSSGFVPLVLPPAKPTRVGSQSEMWISSWLMVPGCFRSGLATNPTPRTPPSHSDHFLPRSGQLLPPDSV